jgi:glycerol-3-phosphate O-acyltransferase
MPHKLGDVVRMSDESAQLIAYYRNNVLHLFALPSLVACAFIANSMLRTEDIQRSRGASIHTWLRTFPALARGGTARVVDGILRCARRQRHAAA